MREGGFPAPDESLDEAGLAKATAFRLPAPSADRVVSSPATPARQTLDAMDLSGEIEPALADMDFGAWSGRALAEVHTAGPEALMAWIADPASGAPGGETMAQLAARVGGWIDAQAADDRRILAVTHISVIRAALVHVLDLPPAAAFRIDVAPLSVLTLSFNRQWRVQALGAPAAEG